MAKLLKTILQFFELIECFSREFEKFEINYAPHTGWQIRGNFTEGTEVDTFFEAHGKDLKEVFEDTNEKLNSWYIETDPDYIDPEYQPNYEE